MLFARTKGLVNVDAMDVPCMAQMEDPEKEKDAFAMQDEMLDRQNTVKKLKSPHASKPKTPKTPCLKNQKSKKKKNQKRGRKKPQLKNHIQQELLVPIACCPPSSHQHL